MASSVTISHEAFEVLTYGQRLSWFLRNLDNIHTPNAHGYTPASIAAETFMDCSISDINKTDREIFSDSTHNLVSKIVTGELNHEDVIFVMVDSCVACDTDINDVINATKDNFPGCYPVLVKTSVNMAENAYKLANAWKYPEVNLKMLQHNLSFFSDNGDVNEDMGRGESIGAYAFPISSEFALVDDAIGNLLSTKGRWEEGDRQEINDDVQVEVLLTLHKRMFFCRAVMFTHDKKMKKKIERAKIFNPNVYIGTPTCIY